MTTGGGVILDNTTDIKIPLNVTLECGGTFTAASNNDYRIFKSDGTPNLTGAIVIDPTTADGGPFTIRSTGKNATYKDCTVEAGAGKLNQVTHVYPNPYSPSVFYPDCDLSTYTGAGNCTDADAAHLNETRASSLIQSAFSNPPNTSSLITQGPAAASVGITSQSGFNIQNVQVIGFGMCISEQGPKPITQNLDCDGSTGISIDTSDVPMIDNAAIGADVTTGEAAFKIDTIDWDNDHSLYKVTVELQGTSGKPGYNFVFQNGDIVWIAPQPGNAESTQGYWVVSNLGTCSLPACTFDLAGSKQSVALDATVNDSGVPPSVLTGMDPTNFDFRYIQIGQTVSDSHGCSSGLTVTNVWPAKGLVYLSGPVACSGTHSYHFTFADNHNSVTASCELTDSAPPATSSVGCAQVDPNFRWGDGIFVRNSGGMRAVNCQVYEHLVSWHMYDGTRSALFSNCTTGNASDLPDRNLDALIATDYPSGNIISVLIDGTHNNPEEDHETDACETDWSNMRLGQHRQTNIVIQSNCDAPNRFSNVATGGGDNGIDLEVDAGGVSMVNAEGNTASQLFKADTAYLYANEEGTLTQLGPFPANLSISNNRLPDATLIMANAAAAASTVGCGNTFVAPTPYLCAPSSFTQLPGGRLTLTRGQPVLTTDTTSSHIHYAPSVSQQIPIYNPAAGSFGLADFGSDLNIDLDGADFPAANLFDVFAEIPAAGSIELCANKWATSGAGTATRSTAATPTLVNGVWVNQGDFSGCFHDTATLRECKPMVCTYLGTFYVTTAGQVSQQFNPAPANGGSGPCVCLYNAYNRVGLMSRSIDNVGYTFSSALPPLWRPMHGATANNRITVVDGLGQMQVGAQLTDLLANNPAATRTAEMGIDFNPPATTPAPTPLVQAGSATPGTYTSTVPQTPVAGGGLWVVQAVEAAVGTGAAASFGSSTGSAQQLSVQVAD